MIIQSQLQLQISSSAVTLEEGKEICKQLREELQKSSVGVGLSAPQIDIFKRVAIIQTSNGYLDLINPCIINLSEPFINLNEGCLSFPSVKINTIRYHKVEIKDDLNGNLYFNSFASVIAQHEIDHLDGILFFDRKVPEPYDLCFCGSNLKFKFCCKSKVQNV